MSRSNENDPPRIHRSDRDKSKLIGAIQCGVAVPEAARSFGFPRSTAYKIKKRFKETGSVTDKPRSGRPPRLDERGKRHLALLARQNRRKPLADVGNLMQPPVPETTTRRYLQSDGYGRYRARKVPFLTPAHRKARRAFVRLYRKYGKGFWRRVISSDECYVYLGDSKGTVYVTHKQNEVYHEDCLVPTFQQSSIRVMVWGCVGIGWKGPLVVLEYPGGRGGGMTAGRYREQVLERCLIDVYDKGKT
jgi:transposase